LQNKEDEEETVLSGIRMRNDIIVANRKDLSLSIKNINKQLKKHV
jgi:hypothetical protein